MNNITKIMALGIWEVGAADCLNKADADFYARQTITALKAAGYAIVPVEPSDKTLRDMAKAIALVSIKTAESEYASGQKLSEKGIEGLVEYFWMKCLPDASAAYRAAIKAGDKS